MKMLIWAFALSTAHAQVSTRTTPPPAAAAGPAVVAPAVVATVTPDPAAPARCYATALRTTFRSGRAQLRTLINYPIARKLCMGATSNAPIECFLRATQTEYNNARVREIQFMGMELASDLCAGATSDAPIACYLAAVMTEIPVHHDNTWSTINPGTAVDLCRARTIP